MHIGLLVNQNVAQPDSGSALGKVLPRRLWQAPAGIGWGPLPELLLTLTLVTGIVDAVSILALGRVFVANMTGNVVFAGFAITGAPGVLPRRFPVRARGLPGRRGPRRADDREGRP